MSDSNRPMVFRSMPVRVLGLGAIALAFLACASSPDSNDAGSTERVSEEFDGLVPIPGARVAMAYVDPEADFSVFQRVAILEPYVAFRANWLRDVNRGRGRRVRASDMERIRADVAALFKQVFTERLEADDGYEVVDVVDHDVLLLRPAIIDLDVAAPNVPSAGRSRTYVATAGAATLYIQLFDAVSGDLIGRAADRQAARQPGNQLTWANGVANTAEARRIFGRWADRLRTFLDTHYIDRSQ